MRPTIRAGAPLLCRALLTALFGLAMSSCTNAYYLSQAVEGQCDLLTDGQPIDQVVADPETPPYLRELLARVPSMKAFGVRHGLLATDSYDEYVALDRPVAVWVVSASHPLKFEPTRWSFPIVGSVPYLGWFERLDADKFADDLRAEGWDVDLRGARAYSTLGWFDDPVLSSMVGQSDDAVGDLANTVLHESVHSTLYVESQSYFNESLANFVGDYLTERYLIEEFGPDSTELAAWVTAEEKGRERGARLHLAYQELDALYRSALSDQDKLKKKRRYLLELQAETSFSRPINNATLVGFKTYNTGDNEFKALLDACGGDLQRFWSAVATIDSDSFDSDQMKELSTIVGPLVLRRCLVSGKVAARSGG